MSGPTAPWALGRGAAVRADGSVRFEVWAPAARAVRVRIVAGRAPVPMARDADGVCAVEVAGVAPGADYVYELDGAARPDPVSRHQPAGVHGASRVVDPAAFHWSDGGWRGRAMAELVLYELHVGTFSDAGTFDGVIPHLGALRDLGVTALELMPVAQFPGARNWGYDGVHPYAPHGAYGGPDGLKRLIDAAHGAGLAVVLDVVYNHLGPEGSYLGDFGPYFTDRYHTPWGRAVNYDGPDSDEVRRYVVDNACYWVTELHVDGLRLDAVHAIYDFGARHLLEELRDAVGARARELERRILVIAESDLNDPRLVRPRARGGYGLDGQWSDDLHHAVHAALTGERQGYYADFSGAAAVAKALRDRFVYDGRHSRFRRRRHGAPAVDVPADRFVVFVQNHDQVGNRAGGERLAALVPFAARKLAAALVLLSPYVPLLFMGEEYGETNPFLYFVSHGDPALVRAVRDGRRREFEAFGWGADVPDPQAEATFARSRLDRARAERPGHAALRALYGDLLRIRREEPRLVPGTARVEVGDGGGEGWIALGLDHDEPGGLLALFNVRGAETTAALPAWARQGVWRPRLATEDARYDGGGAAPGDVGDGAAACVLPAWSATLYRRGEG